MVRMANNPKSAVHKYVPAVVRHRKNVTQAILQDVTVLALMCW